MSTATRTFKLFNREIKISIFKPEKKPDLDLNDLIGPYEMNDELRRAVTRRNIDTPRIQAFAYVRHPY